MKRVFGSFRDISGTVYEDGDRIVRAVNQVYGDHFTRLIESGLRDELVARRYLVPFEEIAPVEGAWKSIATPRIPFISYPFEWCFSQLRDAAILTLQVQIEALKRDMILKDASSFNVAFIGSQPVFIDCLSFETWNEGAPWKGYHQFCSHFLAPLLLMARVDKSLHSLLRVHIDGVPLGLASRMLPKSSWLSPLALFHIHAHAWAQRRYSDAPASAAKASRVRVTKTYLEGLAEQLISALSRLSPSGGKTTWGDYYSACNYTDDATREKLRVVGDVARRIGPGVVLDLGANDGTYSRVARQHATTVISSDFDEDAIERNYAIGRKEKLTDVYPMVLDLANPGSGIGWAGRERAAFNDRVHADLVLALALIHHLVISANVPMPMVADEFARLGSAVLVEFVPPDDEQVRKLTAMRAIGPEAYSLQAFIASFEKHFDQVERWTIPNSERTLHLLKRR